MRMALPPLSVGLKQNSLDISAAFVMSLEFCDVPTGVQSASVVWCGG